MSNWQQLLDGAGARYSGELVMSFGESPRQYSDIANGLASLDNLGILGVHGIEGTKFLQGQSTCNFQNLAVGGVTPGALCNVKGRMISSFIACRTRDDEVLLSMDRALVGPTIAQLKKFAVFFKTELTDASELYRQLGLAGSTLAESLTAHFKPLPGAGESVNDEQGNRLAPLTKGLYLIFSPRETAPELWLSLSGTITPVGLPWWQLQLARAGLAAVTEALSEQLVPQMLNYQATGAISFTKGCYTGQEVVARMQYLGTLKRRTYRIRATTNTTPEIGAELSTADGKNVGTVVLAAPEDENHIAMLAVLREAALDQTQLTINGESIAITLEDLPYSLDIQ